MNKVLSVLFSLTFLLLAGCNLFSNEDDGEQQARIIFGESIELVEIGDSADQVIEKLGKPVFIFIPNFAGRIYVYADGKIETIYVSISKDPGLGLGVISMRVQNSYGGKNKDGVGIGMPRTQVLDTLGHPDKTNESSPQGLIDSYIFDDNRFLIRYREDKISSISMSRPLFN